MKNYAKLFLTGVFAFMPAVVIGQITSASHNDCGFAPALKVYTTERDGTMGGKVSPQVVGILEDGQNCLNDNLIELRANVKFLQSSLNNNGNQTTDIVLVQDKLKQAEVDLHTAQTKIELLEASLDLLNRRLRMAEDEIEWITVKVPATKRKREISKPAPDSAPSTSVPTPHSTSKKSNSSNPKPSPSNVTPANPQR